MDVPFGVRIPRLLRADPGDDGLTEDPERLADVLRTLLPLPKVELHLHLEGTLRPETVCELAGRYESLSPLCRPDWERDYWSFRDLAGFVAEFRQVLRTCIRAPEDYYRMALEGFEELAAQNVVYAEISVSGRAPTWPHYVPLADLLAAVDQARRDVEGRTTLRAGILLGLNRAPPVADQSEAEALACRFVEEALRERERGVGLVGIDLHGDEQTAPSVEPFVAAFRLAAEAGLGLRAHAGEGSGPAAVWASLRQLGVGRIAHGVRAVEDPALIEHLAGSRVALDVCPTSNVLTGAVASLEQHPIRALHDAGVAVTVSSDDPLVFGTTLTAELALLHDRLGFSLAELGRLTAGAARHAFLPDEARSALEDAVRLGWSRFDEVARSHISW